MGVFMPVSGKETVTSSQLLGEVLFDHFDVAVSTGWGKHAYAAIRMYLKAISLSPQCRTSILDSAARHLVDAGRIDADALRKIADELGVANGLVLSLLAGESRADVAKTASRPSRAS